MTKQELVCAVCEYFEKKETIVSFTVDRVIERTNATLKINTCTVVPRGGSRNFLRGGAHSSSFGPFLSRGGGVVRKKSYYQSVC